MTGWAAWVAGWMLAIGPNGWWIDAQWSEVDELQRDLVPIGWLGDTTESLWIVFHRQPGWTMAFYLPPDSADSAAENGSEEMAWARALPVQAGRHFDRLLPHLDVPRLFLRADVYQGNGVCLDDTDVCGGGLVDPSTLAVDSAEMYFNALLEARLELCENEAWRRALAERAEATMSRVPAVHRTQAFRQALLDFGSHVLSVAQEIGRQARRHPPETLCAILDYPATVFGSWQRALGDGRFPGQYLETTEAISGGGGPAAGSRGRWVNTRDVLSEDDKRWFLDTVLGVDWTGDPRRDFARFCRHDM